jgi:multiple sugar transport system substrate-binding protein
MRVSTVLLAAGLMLTAAAARAADLVVWWEEGHYPEEDAAVREIVAAFEQKTSIRVDLTLPSENDLPGRTAAAVEAGHPPDIVYGGDVAYIRYPRWAQEGRLVDLAGALGPLVARFDRDALDEAILLDATTGRRGLFALPMGRITNHVHAWRSLLEGAGFTLADIPQGWEPFWSFWCDKVQPAVRKATGRDDIYGVGLPMSARAGGDTEVNISQFIAAYGANYVTRDGKLVIDEPQVRARLVQALDGYTALYRKGCVPPDATGWDNASNNEAFLDQRVVLTVNNTLSIPGALQTERPEDYARNAVTLAWPRGAHGQPLAIKSQSSQLAVIRAGGHVATATAFVHFLVGEGWLAHWLNFAGDRYLPPMSKLLEGPFWLDPSDPHRMASVMQFMNQPRSYSYSAASGEWRHQQVEAEGVWPKAVHRVAADGISPEQAVDEAIARIKAILGE